MHPPVVRVMAYRSYYGTSKCIHNATRWMMVSLIHAGAEPARRRDGARWWLAKVSEELLQGVEF